MKKTNLKLTVSFLLSFLLVLFILPIKAQWVIFRSNDEDTRTATSSNSKQNVCYIAGDTDANGYTTVEAGLAAATKKGGSQKVVVTANTTITHDCVISAGVELVLPCDRTGESKDTMLSFDEFYTFDTSVCVSVNTNSVEKRKLTLKAVRKVYGTLSILGQFGGSSSKFTSHTFGSYSTLYLDNDAQLQIQNGGKRNCFGYIKQATGSADKQIIVNSGGEVYEPITIYDWPGGTPAVKYALIDQIFPFYKYDLPNIGATLTLQKGSFFYGLLQINRNEDGKDSKTRVFQKSLIVGAENALILLTDGYLNWNFSSTSTTDFSKHLTSLTLSGSGKIGSLSVYMDSSAFGELDELIKEAIKTGLIEGSGDQIKISSSKYFLPINSGFSISTSGKGSFDATEKTMWMPGSKLTIGSETTCDITADFAAFYSPDDNNTSSGNANIVNNGTRKFKCDKTKINAIIASWYTYSGSFGGKISGSGKVESSGSDSNYGSNHDVSLKSNWSGEVKKYKFHIQKV